MKDIQELLNIKIEELLQSQYGPLSFESEKSKIVFIKEILEQLNDIDPILFQSKINAISVFINRVKNLFNALQNYHGAYREDQIQKLNDITSNVPTEIYALIAMNISVKNKAISDKAIKSKFKEIDSIVEKIKQEEQEIKQLGTESEDILKNMKANMATTGIADYADIFQKESNIHKKNSQYWFYGIIGIVIVIIIMAVCLLYGCLAPKDNTMTTLVQFTFAKLIIFSSLFFILTLAVKSYKASKHNEILNKHRQNAITTFEKFVKSANDDKTKNAVLLQTVNAIFSQQNTGYNDNDNDTASPQTKFLEIINSSVKND